MLYCPGSGCPFRHDCTHHTQPNPGRDQFGALPYDAETHHCDAFVSNIPDAATIRESAYYLWLRRSCPSDQAEAIWAEAERLLCISTGRVRYYTDMIDPSSGL